MVVHQDPVVNRSVQFWNSLFSQILCSLRSTLDQRAGCLSLSPTTDSFLREIFKNEDATLLLHEFFAVLEHLIFYFSRHEPNNNGSRAFPISFPYPVNNFNVLNSSLSRIMAKTLSSLVSAVSHFSVSSVLKKRRFVSLVYCSTASLR